MGTTNVDTSKKTSPYDCGNPGSKYPATPKIGSCDWNLQPPLNEYQWVTAGGKQCKENSDCTNGTKCGISFNPGHADLLQETCGTLLGFWSAD